MLPAERIDGLTKKDGGHRFVFYGDSCSGVPGGPHEETLAATNEVVAQLDPAPDFVIFAGDEIVGLSGDEAELRAQWSHWLNNEMGWLDRSTTPLYHTTSNHTTYDAMSERVFADVLDHLPRNGPPNQQGLSYFVRRDDLLLVFVNTCHTGLGGEGHVETEWLDRVLVDNNDARFKFVAGHHPVFPINGFAGEYQRELGHQDGRRFWDVLVRHDVLAYLCSHILAYDVQVHRGVLQLLSAGAGTAQRMPADVEYLHFVQATVDGDGFRFQAIDHDGVVRERLSWPPQLPPSADWARFNPSSSEQEQEQEQRADGQPSPPTDRAVTAWRFCGVVPAGTSGDPQPLLSADPEGNSLPTFWVGFTGPDRRLTVTMAPAAGRSPHYWFGPNHEAGARFDFQLLLHREMGPGGVLHRYRDDGPWSSLRSASPWGLERLIWPPRWILGRYPAGAELSAWWFEEGAR